MIDFHDEWEEEGAFSLPTFPPFRRKQIHRTLAYMEKNILYIEGIQRTIFSYNDMVDAIFTCNLLTFTDSIVSFPFLKEAVHDFQAEVVCSKKGKPLSIRIKRKNSTRWITTFNSWSLDPSIESLQIIQDVFDYVNVGTYTSPGGLGHAVMYKVWNANNLHYHTTCNGYVDCFIRLHSFGGRCDTPGIGNSYDSVLEFDLSSGYLAHYQVHPSKTPEPFKKGIVSNDYKTYFAQANVFVPDRLHLGPFPIRADGYKANIVYPTEKGLYDNVFLWKEQVKEVAKTCEVEVVEGYGWRELSSDNTFYADEMFKLKQHAPSKQIESIIKLAIVASIGRHGMGNEFYVLSSEESDTALFDDGEWFDDMYIHKRIDYHSSNCLHWHNYTVSMCNLSLFKFAYHFAIQNTLICTNYDSVMVVPREEYYSLAPERGKGIESLGMWRWQELHNVKIRAPRSFESDEKTVLPGIAKEDR